jgi:hypothetical protein
VAARPSGDGMRSTVKAIPISAAKLFRSGAELCPVLGFRSVDVAADALDEASGAMAICRFTVPLGPPIHLEEAADYELVFDSGARFPIRIRQLFIRADVQSTSVRDIFAELI